MGLHLSLVAYLIIDLANFICPLLHHFLVAHDLFEIGPNIKFYLFTLLKIIG
jgi:hypothetical protein